MKVKITRDNYKEALEVAKANIIKKLRLTSYEEKILTAYNGSIEYIIEELLKTEDENKPKTRH